MLVAGVSGWVESKGMGMDVIYFLLLLGGFLCFMTEAFIVRPERVTLIALGLGLWILVPLIHAAQGLG